MKITSIPMSFTIHTSTRFVLTIFTDNLEILVANHMNRMTFCENAKWSTGTPFASVELNNVNLFIF